MNISNVLLLEIWKGLGIQVSNFCPNLPGLGYEIRRVLKSLIRMGVGFISKRFEIEDD